MSFVALKVFCVRVSVVHVCIFLEHCDYDLENHTHLKMNFVRPWKFFSSFRIGTLVVVEKRAVIEDQAQVRLIVGKGIIAKDLAVRKVLRQKQCLPAYRHHHTLFESAPCKNPETSCLESRGKF